MIQKFEDFLYEAKLPFKPSDVKFIRCVIKVATHHDEEEMPLDLPNFAKDRVFDITIDLKAKKVLNWKYKEDFYLCIKAVDGGSYYLLDKNKEVIAKLEREYVPNECLPGEYGDYLELEVTTDGHILNLLDKPKYTEFATKVNEAKVTLKRKYGVHPPHIVGSHAPIRERVLAFVKEKGTVSEEEVQQYIQGIREEGGKEGSSKWLKYNTQYFNIKNGNVAISQKGERFLASKTLNEESNYGYKYPLIPDAVNALKKAPSVKYTNKAKFVADLDARHSFSGSYSHCSYTKEEHDKWSKNGNVYIDKDSENSILYKDCGDLVAVWDEKHKIGYILGYEEASKYYR